MLSHNLTSHSISKSILEKDLGKMIIVGSDSGRTGHFNLLSGLFNANLDDKRGLHKSPWKKFRIIVDDHTSPKQEDNSLTIDGESYTANQFQVSISISDNILQSY